MGTVWGAGVFIGGTGIGGYTKAGGAVGWDISGGLEGTWTGGSFGGTSLDIAAGTTAFAGGVSVNPSSVSVSAQAAPAAPPVNWRVGLTTTTPHYVLDCRQ